MAPACGSGTLTNVLPHRNVMPQTQDMTPYPITVCRYRANLSLWFFIDVEHHTTIHNYPFKCLGSDPIGKPFLSLQHTPANAQLNDAIVVVVN